MAYGRTAAIALGLGLVAGFGVGLYALGVPAFGWPAAGYASLVQAHGQVQTLGLAGLLILGVGGLLLPGFWRVRLARPNVIPLGGGLVGLGLLAQIVGQPLAPGPIRQILLLVAALLPIAGFAWAGSALIRPRLERRGQSADRLAPWEALLLLAACSLIAGLVLRAIVLLDLAWSGLPASYGVIHQMLIALELDGFLLAATVGVQLRLLPSLARVRPVTGWPEHLGVGLLALGVVLRTAALGLALPGLADAGAWLTAGAVLALFWATGLGRAGLPRTVQAPATLLPGRTRHVLRVAWAALLIGVLGRALGLLTPDVATHAFTSGYLMPLVLVVGFRMLPRVSAYPVRFPKLCGALIWAGVLGGLLRAFGGLLAGQVGWQAGWVGGGVLTVAMIVFAALVWSPWGVPTGVPRTPEVVAAYVSGSQRR